MENTTFSITLGHEQSKVDVEVVGRRELKQIPIQNNLDIISWIFPYDAFYKMNL